MTRLTQFGYEQVPEEDKARRVVWRPVGDGLDARLERKAMSALAGRLAADRKLAARWRELAVAAHGDVVEEARA